VADKRTASLWRQAIREAAAPYTCSEMLLDVDKEFGTDTKSLWGKILDLLPTYAIFKADREAATGIQKLKTLTAGRKRRSGGAAGQNYSAGK
jgi:hypothetical protein